MFNLGNLQVILDCLDQRSSSPGGLIARRLSPDRKVAGSIPYSDGDNFKFEFVIFVSP
jgi:hypothetical protein